MAVINGTAADETLTGTAAADTITSGDGKDTVLMLGGNDLFVWNPEDYNDTIDGGTGKDTVRFTGAGVPEPFNIFALVGGDVRLDRLGDNLLDLDAVERVELHALGGADTIQIKDLSGTDLKQVAVDLSNGTPGVGDGAVDTVTVDAGKGNNTITISQVGGLISTTGLPAQITLAAADVDNDFFEIRGLAGNDKISAAKLPKALILKLDGGEGNDSITGSAGNDTLTGGDGNDTVTGGGGDDFADLGDGNDLFVCNPGDGSDFIEGGDGNDTLRGVGTAADGLISIDRNGALAVLSGIDAHAEANDVERIEIRPLGGVDSVDVSDLTGTDVTSVVVDLAGASGGAAADRKVDDVDIEGTGLDDTMKIASVGGQVVVSGLSAQVSVTHADRTDLLGIFGLAGNDTIDASKLAAGKLVLEIFGGDGLDQITGSAGNDFVIGGDANDLVFLGAGDDIFRWIAGDDSDTIEGQAGKDTVQFFGNVAAENIDIFAGSGRAQVFRDVDNATVSLNDVERIELEARGGTDNITVGDLTGTDVTLVTIDLGAFGAFGVGGDLVKDTVTVAGTNGNDKITVTSPSGTVLIAGLPSQVSIIAGEADKDSVTINGFGGNDTIDASKVAAGAVPMALNGGGGNDTVTGGAGRDVLSGSDGDDVLKGGGNIDTLRGGVGNDLFLWGLDDGGDVVEGEGGSDTLRVTWSKLDNAANVLADGVRATINTPDGANLDIDDVERIEIRALGGADTIFVGNLADTDVTEVAIDLAATAGGKAADTKIDTVFATAADGDDTVAVASSKDGKVSVSGLAAQISIDHAGKTDVLNILGGGGEDVIDATAFAANKMALQINGGLGADHVFGSAGNDAVTGGDGDDSAFLGAGNDRFIWNQGDDNDLIEGQAGLDTLEFNGTNIADIINIEANGGRVIFRGGFNAFMDLNDVERIEFQALGGDDEVRVQDLSGTDVTQVAIDLASTSGTPDGSEDTVTTFGTTGNDVVKIASVGGAVSITGLPAKVTVDHADDLDDFSIRGLDGNDSINGSALKASSGQLFVDGGSGNDTITGGAGNDSLSGLDDNDKILGGGGNDFLFGDSGDDKLDGGAGNDVLFGGTGNDVLTGGIGNDTLNGSQGDDTLTGGAGSDTFSYNFKVDGHDLIIGFDGNAAGGQDVLDLNILFDDLGVLAADRASRVLISDNGASVDIFVDADGSLFNNGFELAVATLKTADVVTIGADILVGT